MLHETICFTACLTTKDLEQPVQSREFYLRCHLGLRETAIIST